MTKDEFLNMMIDAKNDTTSIYDYRRFCCNAIGYAYKKFKPNSVPYPEARYYFEEIFGPTVSDKESYTINYNVFFGSVDGFQKERGIALELFERVALDEREYLKW